MVVHDRVQTEQWAQERALKEQAKPPKQPKEKRRQDIWTVTAVQSLACVVLAVFVLLFRLIGGDAYEGIRQGFHRAMEKNELMAVWSRLWDGDPFYDLEYTDEDSVKQEDFTE